MCPKDFLPFHDQPTLREKLWTQHSVNRMPQDSGRAVREEHCLHSARAPDPCGTRKEIRLATEIPVATLTVSTTAELLGAEAVRGWDPNRRLEHVTPLHVEEPQFILYDSTSSPILALCLTKLACDWLYWSTRREQPRNCVGVAQKCNCESQKSRANRRNIRCESTQISQEWKVRVSRDFHRLDGLCEAFAVPITNIYRRPTFSRLLLLQALNRSITKFLANFLNETNEICCRHLLGPPSIFGRKTIIANVHGRLFLKHISLTFWAGVNSSFH